MKRFIPHLLLIAAATSFIMGLASPLLTVSSRVVVGIGRLEFPAVEFAETYSIPQTVARLGRDGDVALMLVALCSCMIFPALKLAIIGVQTFGRGPSFWKGASRFLERWSFLELLVCAVFLTVLKADEHLEAHSGAAVGWLVAAIVLSAGANAAIARGGNLPIMRRVLALLMVAGLSSCGKPAYQHIIRLDNLGTLAINSGVTWKGAEIGKVESIRPDNGKLKVTMSIYPDFAGALHDGAIAEVPAYALPGLRGRITIIGGDNPAAAILVSGTELPAREINAVTDTVGLAKEYLKQTATEVQKKFEAGTADLKREIPKKLGEASNAAADSLESLAKKLRKAQPAP